MTELVSTTLENEMDLILAYKKSVKTGAMLGLTVSTQTAFATAVSEVCREVIDKALDGKLKLSVENEDGRFFIVAVITFTDNDNLESFRQSFEYAKNLVPVFDYLAEAEAVTVLLKLGIPRSAGLDAKRVNDLKKHFEAEGPINPYEEVKLKNVELNKLYEEREMALTHADYLNKQKDEFLFLASHELNTPLTVLTTLAQLALRIDNGSNEKVSDYLKKIEMQSSKLRTLISQLLVISKIDGGQPDYKMELTDTNSFITSCTDLVSHFVHEHALKMELDATRNVLIDRLRIEQVIDNLVCNASEYSPPGSTIYISTTTDDTDIYINVRDEGIGMSEETVANVFEKFYRSENVAHSYRGLGMGLYIASRIVADHKGEILVTSKEGEGSVFTVRLPLAIGQ